MYTRGQLGVKADMTIAKNESRVKAFQALTRDSRFYYSAGESKESLYVTLLRNRADRRGTRTARAFGEIDARRV